MTDVIYIHIYYLFIILSLTDIAIWLYSYRNALRSLSYIYRDCNTHVLKDLPAISIIIPARNVRSTISRCLDSIVDMARNFDEIIVVDDGSTDGTDEIILRYLNTVKNINIKYIRIDGIPSGWNPKSYSCYIGYKHSKGQILLFLDGDTWFLNRDSIYRLARCAYIYGVASYMPKFVCLSRRCKAIETVLTTFSHAFTGFNRVSNPKNSFSWFYGCCWAIKRNLYEAIDGHKSIYNELLEDKAIATKLKSIGILPVILDGSRDIETLWYSTISDTVNALTRILYSYVHRDRVKGFISGIAIALGYLLPLIDIAIGIALFRSLLFIGISLYIVICLVHTVGSKVNSYSSIYVFTAPLIGMVIPIAILRCIFVKDVVWRDRKLSIYR